MKIKEIEANNSKINLDNPNDLLKQVGDQICINFKNGKSQLDNEIQDNFHQILKGTKLSNRIIFIRHGQTSLEGTDQPDDINILPQEYEKIQELNEKILKAGLGTNNVYFLSNNRTARIEQTADKIIKGLDLYYGRTDVSFLDTTNKQIKKNVRIAMINGLSSILVDQIIDLVKGTENVQIISVIHSSNQNSIEGYLQTNPFKKNEKLKNLSTLTIDLNDKGIIDYSINEGFQLTQDNFQQVRNNLDELSKYGNKDIINDIIKHFDGEEFSIIDKQNILNYYLYSDLELIENVVSKGTHIGLVLKSLNLLVNKYGKFENRFNKKHFENILKLLKNSNNAEIWELIKIIKDKSYETKILYWIESEIGFDNEFMLYLSNRKDTETKKLLKNIKKIKKTILGKKIMFRLFMCMFLLSIPIGHYLYDNNKFIQTFKNNPEDLTKLQFNDFNYKNLETYGNLNIDLSGIKSLDSKQAYYLMQMNFQVLDLSGLELLTDETAQELSKFKGAILKLNGLTTITSMQFEKISTFCTKLGGVIQLNTIEKVDYETMIKIINFEGKEIQLKSLTFQYDLPNFLLINSFKDYWDLYINTFKFNLSDEYYIQAIQILDDKDKFDEYKNNMLKIMAEINNSIFDSNENIYNNNLLDQATINELKSLEYNCSAECVNYLKKIINYFQLVKLPYKPYLQRYFQDFFNNNMSKFSSFSINTIEYNKYEFISFFEKEFGEYLKTKISIEEFNILEKQLYENINYLYHNTALTNYNHRYIENVMKKYKDNENFTTVSNGFEKVEKINTYHISIENDNLLANMLESLNKSDKYNVIIKKINKLSNIKDKLEIINIKNLYIDVVNVDVWPILNNCENLIINNERINSTGSSISRSSYPYSLEVNLRVKDSNYFYFFANGLVDKLVQNHTKIKGLKIDLEGLDGIYSELKLSTIMKFAKINCDNLFLGNFNYRKDFVEKFAKKFSSNNFPHQSYSFLKIDRSDKENTDIKEDWFLNSMKNLYPNIEIFQNKNSYEIGNINIFKPSKFIDGIESFEFNKAIYVGDLESLELDIFTILKNNNINLLIDSSRLLKVQQRYKTIKLIVNTNNKNLEKELNEFIIYFKVVSSNYYAKDYFKFEVIFDGPQDNKVIELLKSCNMISPVKL